jgi:hypothetical protein
MLEFFSLVDSTILRNGPQCRAPKDTAELSFSFSMIESGTIWFLTQLGAQYHRPGAAQQRSTRRPAQGNECQAAEPTLPEVALTTAPWQACIATAWKREE